MVTNFVLSVSYLADLVLTVALIPASSGVPWLVLSFSSFFQSLGRIISILFGVSALALEFSFHLPCWFSG
jgi:hypothetical protein